MELHEIVSFIRDTLGPCAEHFDLSINELVKNHKMRLDIVCRRNVNLANEILVFQKVFCGNVTTIRTPKVVKLLELNNLLKPDQTITRNHDRPFATSSVTS